MKKTTFILPMFLSNMIAGVGSGAMIYFSGGNPIWVAALLATFTAAVFLAGAFERSKANDHL